MLRHGTCLYPHMQDIQCRYTLHPRHARASNTGGNTQVEAQVRANPWLKLNIVLDENYRETVTFNEAVLCFLKLKPASSKPVHRKLIENFIHCGLDFQAMSLHVQS